MEVGYFFPQDNQSIYEFISGRRKRTIIMYIFKNNWDNYFRVNYSHQEI